MKLIIAEKKDIANLLRDVLPGKFTNKEGYYRSSDYCITWGWGHLLKSKEPGEYPLFIENSWNWSLIPFIPPNNQLEYVIPSKTDFDKNVRAKQINNIKNLVSNENIQEVINACDAEREGELIFWEIYHYLQMKQPVKRLWLQSKEESDVKKAFNELKEEKFYQPKKEASYARQYADYILGHNLTMAFTIKANNLLHIGRVQTPTLAFLVNRRKHIDNFQTETYYEIDAIFAEKYKGKWFKDKKTKTSIQTSEEAEQILEKIRGKDGKVIIKETEETKESPKKLYNLGALQKDASNKYGFTARETLQLTQELYDKYKVVSYPRSSSTHIMNSQVPGLKDVLSALQEPEYSSFAVDIINKGIPTSKHFVDDKKVSDHYAIIPTKKRLTKTMLQDDSSKGIKKENLLKIYDLIVRRFLSVFYPPAVYEKTEIVTEVAGETFKTNGKVLMDPGWKRVYGTENIDEKKDSKEKQLPPIELNEVNNVSSIKKLDKQTKPKPHYTESALISAMENAKDYIEEDDLKETMKEEGATAELGTEATRDSIIESLIAREYAVRRGKNLIATDLGMSLIEIAPENLKSPEITGSWETKLKMMENKEYNLSTFKQEIEKFVFEEISNLKSKKIKMDSLVNTDLGKCPKCDGNILDYPQGIACESTTGDKVCLKIRKFVARKKLTNQQIKDLLSGKETEVIKGLQGKTKKFDAKLKLKDTLDGFNFIFPENKEITKCPKCSTPVVRFPTFFACGKNSRTSECTIGPTKYAGRKLTDKDISGLVNKNETDFVSFVSKRTKKKYKAKIKKNNGKLEMEFEPK